MSNNRYEDFKKNEFCLSKLPRAYDRAHSRPTHVISRKKYFTIYVVNETSMFVQEYRRSQALGIAIAKFCLERCDVGDVLRICPRTITRQGSLTWKKMHTTQQVAKMHRKSE